jgi:DNA-binding XRE family transcriptional regulator
VVLSLLTVKNPVVLKALGLRIKALRMERNLSQEELGLMSDVAEPTIQRLETAKYGCSIDNIISIANAMNISLKDLFDFEA